MSKLLQHWGLGRKLKAKAVPCPKIDFVDGETGERRNTIVYHPELIRELQADMYGICVSDFLQPTVSLLKDKSKHVSL